MHQSLTRFLQSAQIHDMSVTDRLIALLWYLNTVDKVQTTTFEDIHKIYTDAEYPALAKSRERAKLVKDRRTTSKDNGTVFGLHPKIIPQLNSTLSTLIKTKPIAVSNTLVDLSEFENTKSYLRPIILQINGSYDHGFYDCTAVMLRRLLETLVIELYERLGRSDELKGKDGHFQMFAGLLSYIEKDNSINFGRRTISGLKAFKEIADSSAHARRFFATKKIIDDKVDGLRLSINELVTLAYK